MADPSGARRLPKGFTPALRLATTLGFVGGFLLAYQRSSMRFWGWKENVRSLERCYPLDLKLYISYFVPTFFSKLNSNETWLNSAL